MTDVVFRRFRAKPREVMALFPGLPGTNDTSTCLSYARIGQHSAATVWLADNTELAKETDEDVIQLKAELERIGYKLRVMKRMTSYHWEQRKAAIRAALPKNAQLKPVIA